MGIPVLKIRQSWDCLMFNMGIPILVGQHLYIDTAPSFLNGQPDLVESLDTSTIDETTRLKFSWGRFIDTNAHPTNEICIEFHIQSKRFFSGPLQRWKHQDSFAVLFSTHKLWFDMVDFVWTTATTTFIMQSNAITMRSNITWYCT